METNPQESFTRTPVPRRPSRFGSVARACVPAGVSCVLGLCLAAAPVHAATGFAFLEIPTGARASALGGAFTTLGNGVEAAFWNPAELDRVQGVQVMGGHYELFQQLRHDHFAMATRVGGVGASASIRALYSEPIEERDDVGNLIGSFGAHDLEFALGVGRAVVPGVRLGASAQVLRERIANLSTTTYAFSFGGAWEPSFAPGLETGVMVQGLGPTASYTIDEIEGESIALPASVQTGASYSHGLGARMSLKGALEGRFTRGRPGVGMIGAELNHPTGAALRLGVRVNDDATSYSAGAGYAIGTFHLDYAYVPMQLDLGATHRFSFATQF